jgi:hypothetical protein
VVDDKEQPVGSCDSQFFAARMQFTDPWVPQAGGDSFPAADIVTGPQTTKPLAFQAQLADELRQARVIRVGTGWARSCVTTPA